MAKHFRSNSRTLYNASVRSKVTLENSNTACFTIRSFDRSDSVRIKIDATFDILTNCLTCSCDKISMKKSFFIKLVHNGINTACFFKVFHICSACRSKMAEIGSLLADIICNVKVNINTAFVCNSRKMKHCVC